MVDRFVNTEAETNAFSVRVITIGHPDWRIKAKQMLHPVAVQTQGIQAWLVEKEDAALLLAELRKRTDFREHSSPQLLVNNGQSTTVAATRPKTYVRDITLHPNAWPAYEPEMGQFDEGFALEFSPLLSLDGQTIDAVIKCHIDQLEKLVPVMMDVPSQIATHQRVKIEVPQITHCRLHERFRWPTSQMLLVGLGVVPMPVPTDPGPAEGAAPLVAVGHTSGPAGAGRKQRQNRRRPLRAAHRATRRPDISWAVLNRFTRGRLRLRPRLDRPKQARYNWPRLVAISRRIEPRSGSTSCGASSSRVWGSSARWAIRPRRYGQRLRVRQQRHRAGPRRARHAARAPLPVKRANSRQQSTTSARSKAEPKKSIRKGLKVMCRESQMGVAAAQRALSDARSARRRNCDPERSGVVFGSDYMLTAPDEFSAPMRACVGRSGVSSSRAGPRPGMPQLSPLWLLKYLPNMPASHIAIYNDLRGPEQFADPARSGVKPGGRRGFSRHPARPCRHDGRRRHRHARPSDEGPARRNARRNRSQWPGPPAGLPAVRSRSHWHGSGRRRRRDRVEELESAKSRGARIYAEIVGAGASSVVDRKRVARRDQALKNAMRAALRDAGVGETDVGHINAHGLGTRSGDADEAAAIREVFGPRADKLPVTAVKSYFGNLGAGSGLVELAASTLALAHNRLFAILNYETPDPDCPIAAVTNGDALPGDSFLKLSVTPQGQARRL